MRVAGVAGVGVVAAGVVVEVAMVVGVFAEAVAAVVIWGGVSLLRLGVWTTGSS